MKIIKKGRKQKGWAKKYKCTGNGNDEGGCGAILLVEECDLFQTYRSSMGRDEDWYVTFECLQCGVKTDITDSKFNGRELHPYKSWKTSMMCHGVCNHCNGHNCDFDVCEERKCDCINKPCSQCGETPCEGVDDKGILFCNEGCAREFHGINSK